MEWDAQAIVLEVRPFGEADTLASVLSGGDGVYRGLVRGGQSRGKAGIWQPGNLVQARWVARLAEQLGGLTAELIYPAAAHAMADRRALAVLTSACAIAAGALPERAPHPQVFAALARLLARLADPDLLTHYIFWEMLLLSDLGYGLDLSACALTGATGGLAYVSPRSGRAVTAEAAGEWRDRLLPLPGFLVGGNLRDAEAWRDGLRLAGHFLARDAFGHQHRPMPEARFRLLALIEAAVPEG
jgi:DNA repair protein RecO (recombination protein O)